MPDSNMMLTNGEPVPADDSHTAVDPSTGQQRGYVVLTPEERAKGFVRPVRTKYVHAGKEMCGVILGDWHDSSNLYGDGAKTICGGAVGHDGEHGHAGDQKVFVATAAEIERLRRTGRYKGCGAVTWMGNALAETYARQPDFYSGTFCATCRKHFHLDEFEWEDGEPMDVSLQPAWHEREQRRRQALKKAQKALNRAEWEARRAALRRELARLEAEEPKE